MAKARCEITRRPDGQYQFVFKAPNGTTVMTSEMHDCEHSVMGATMAMRTLAADAELVDLTGEG